MQVAIAAALLADGGVTALVGQAVLSPLNAAGQPYPFIELGNDQIVQADDGMCNEVWAQIDIWAEARLQTKQIAAAVRAVLAPDLPVPPALAVAGHRVLSGVLHDARYLIDGDPTEPDQRVSHGVLQFRFQTVPLNA